jgi:hypothetical protein
MPTPAAPAAVAVCHNMYAADLRPAHPYAFIMSLPATGQSFTVYAARPDAYTIGAEYTLALTRRTPPTPPGTSVRAEAAR